MLPSKNLFSAAGFKAHYVPKQAIIRQGCTSHRSRIYNKVKPRVFRNKRQTPSRRTGAEKSTADTPVHIVEDNNEK
jgi:hypothetical protein